jgi:hypothetical protein
MYKQVLLGVGCYKPQGKPARLSIPKSLKADKWDSKVRSVAELPDFESMDYNL